MYYYIIVNSFLSFLITKLLLNSGKRINFRQYLKLGSLQTLLWEKVSDMFSVDFNHVIRIIVSKKFLQWMLYCFIFFLLLSFCFYLEEYNIAKKLLKSKSGAHLAGGLGGPDPCPFSIQSKLCSQILQPI